MKSSNERDQSVERLLRQSFGTPPQQASGACLDAETSAAWLDGGLSGAALEAAESHVADCARCQLVLGGIVRSEPRVPVPARSWWPAWLVPLGAATAAAAAVVLWVVVPGGRPVQESQQKQEIQATSAAPETPAAAAPAATGAPAVSGAPESLDKLTATPLGQLAEAPKTKDVPAAAADSRRDAARLEADQAAPDRKAAAEAPPPAAFESRELLRSQVGNAAAAAAPVATEIVSPDPAIRWRTRGSILERSGNGGSSWDQVPVETTAMLLDGAAPAATICWVVGRDGVVLRSTDGRSFSRVPFPEMTDLSSIRAVDGRAATVTAADGRLFDTTDAGLTWVRR